MANPATVTPIDQIAILETSSSDATTTVDSKFAIEVKHNGVDTSAASDTGVVVLAINATAAGASAAGAVQRYVLNANEKVLMKGGVYAITTRALSGAPTLSLSYIALASHVS